MEVVPELTQLSWVRHSAGLALLPDGGLKAMCGENKHRDLPVPAVRTETKASDKPKAEAKKLPLGTTHTAKLTK